MADSPRIDEDLPAGGPDAFAAGSGIWGMPNSPEQLGELVAARRHELGLTQASLADDARVTRRFVHDVESGRATIYLRRLFATLDVLGYRMILQPRDEAPVAVQAEPVLPPDVKSLGW